METKGQKMIKKFENFQNNDQDLFEEVKDFFIEMIDDGCELHHINIHDDESPNEYKFYSTIVDLSKKYKNIVSVHLTLPKMTILQPTEEGHPRDTLADRGLKYQKEIQKFLNKHGFGIINVLPNDKDISHIKMERFFNTELLVLMKDISNIELIYLDRYVGRENISINMVFRKISL